MPTNRGIIEPDDIEIARIFVEMDDDNAPAPETRPQTGESQQNNVFGEGGHPGTCSRRMENARVVL